LDFSDPEAAAVVSVLVTFDVASLVFSNFAVTETSLQNTGSELKFLTESTGQENGLKCVELTSYKFLGEDPNGLWVVTSEKVEASPVKYRWIHLLLHSDVFIMS
jgi:hypothetical protein